MSHRIEQLKQQHAEEIEARDVIITRMIFEAYDALPSNQHNYPGHEIMILVNELRVVGYAPKDSREFPSVGHTLDDARREAKELARVCVPLDSLNEGGLLREGQAIRTEIALKDACIVSLSQRLTAAKKLWLDVEKQCEGEYGNSSADGVALDEAFLDGLIEEELERSQ